ncbi:hypothetical protein PIB30_000793 [Stylosanthes scabra]|uniref:Uncharacterized protein n=1 Tax=Stylosanthes scabra TaxID=79078 RepID=A0ABU6Q296_9FABA|nr:hypothetical protein [Stylosanthes scabra]
MMQTEHLPHTPSFSSYSSSETFAQIAARVIHELQHDPLYANHHHDTLLHDHNQHQNDNDDEFEFSIVPRDPAFSPAVDNIAPTCYPLFGREVLLNGVGSDPAPAPARRRLPLRALMLEERENSKKNNELEGVPEESYCVWTPRSCKKSSSAGSTSSSRRWKLRDLLLRSHSDGKEPILFHNNNNSNENKEGGERSKRRLFLPYRVELLGLFGNNNNNNNGLGGRDSHPSSNHN